MDWKKIGKVFIFPHIAIMIILVPISAVFLVYSLIFLGAHSFVSIASYLIAFYTLMVWCLKIPDLIRAFKQFKQENRFIQKWKSDAQIRMNVSLYGTLFFNAAYALLLLGMGFWHRTFWFCALAGYYLSLAVMRFFLVRHTRKHQLGDQIQEELRKYRACGIVFLVMNVALALMIFFMLYWNRTFYHHEITAITLAAYTFAAFTLAIVNMVKHRKNHSPVYSASQAINLTAACVSMLTLESTLMTTFGDGTMNLTGRRIMLGVTGSLISLFVIVLAIYMIVQGTKKIRLIEKTKE